MGGIARIKPKVRAQETVYILLFCLCVCMSVTRRRNHSVGGTVRVTPRVRNREDHGATLCVYVHVIAPCLVVVTDSQLGRRTSSQTKGVHSIRAVQVPAKTKYAK